MKEKVCLYSYRYMWSVKDNEKSLNFRIVTDTPQGLENFEKALKSDDTIVKIGREYICTFEVEKIGKFEDVINI